jgi:hypothetical protein
MAASRLVEGAYLAYPINLDAFPVLLGWLRAALVVVLSCTDAIEAAVDEVLVRHEWPVFHVHLRGGAKSVQQLSRESLIGYCAELAEVLMAHPGHELAGRLLSEGLEDWEERLVPQDVPFHRSSHNLSAPNQAALEAFDSCYLAGPVRPEVYTENGPYWALQLERVEAVESLRAAAVEANAALSHISACDLILTAAGMLREWRSLRDKFEAAPGDSQRILKSVVSQLVARPKFSLDVRGEDVPNVMGDEVMSAIHLYNRDLAAYTNALSIRTSGALAPTIRVPNDVNRVRQDFANLGRSLLGRRATPYKLSRIARRASERLTTGLPNWVRERLTTSERIKLVSDAPLEWMEVDGFPLMLRRDVSRLPVTPGNLFFGECVQPAPVVLPASRFDEVLVVRSFAPDDPLAGWVEAGIRQVLPSRLDERPRVSIVDVENEEQFVRAVSAFDGAVMVYDGHAAHRPGDLVGRLQLAGEELDVWSLRGRVRLPPICVLSACDTHPIDGSHATIASGILACGARTVWATGVPVRAREAGVLIARLILRMSHFIPFLLGRPFRSFRWSELIPGLQRRQFVTESLRTLRCDSRFSLSDDQIRDIMLEVGYLIDRGPPDDEWLARLIELVAEHSEQEPALSRDVLRRTAYYTDALAYTMYGNPEHVIGARLPEAVADAFKDRPVPW